MLLSDDMMTSVHDTYGTSMADRTMVIIPSIRPYRPYRPYRTRPYPTRSESNRIGRLIDRLTDDRVGLEGESDGPVLPGQTLVRT